MTPRPMIASSVVCALTCLGCGVGGAETASATTTPSEATAGPARYLAPTWDDTDQAGDGDFDTNLLLAILADTESASRCTASRPSDLVLAVTVGETDTTIVSAASNEEDRALGVCLEDVFRDRVRALRCQGGSVRHTVHVHLRVPTP